MSTLYRIGLGVLGALSVVDLATPLITDGQHPPMAIAVIASGLGLASLVLVVLAWRTGSLIATIGFVAIRLLSALLAVPAFSRGVPAPIQVLAGTGIGLTLVGSCLALAALRRPQRALA